MYSNHTGHGCPEEGLEQLLNQIDIDAAANLGVNLLAASGRVKLLGPDGYGYDGPIPTDPAGIIRPSAVKTKKASRKQLRRLLEQAAPAVQQAMDQADAAEKERAAYGAKADYLGSENVRLLAQLDEARDTLEKIQRDRAALIRDRDAITAAQSLQIAEYGQLQQRLDRTQEQLDEAHALVDDLTLKNKVLTVDVARADVDLPHALHCSGGPLICAMPSEHPALSETWAVPKCNLNRWEQVDFGKKSLQPAPYCVSENCARCNAYRRENGVAELVPNGWLRDLDRTTTAAALTALPELQNLTASQAAALPETQGAFAALGLQDTPPGDDV